MSPHLRAGLGALLVAACTPELDPGWLVTGPRELAIDVEVVAQGPYGARIEPGPRTARDALPLDTLRLRPAVVDVDGIVDPEALDATWIACANTGSCLLQGTIADRPACSGEELQPPEPCRFADGAAAELVIADLPRDLPPEGTTVFELIGGPTVSFVASVPGGPGLDACLRRFDARERLDGCLMMERGLVIGPLGELAEALRSLGIDPGIGEEAATLLGRPRNHNPAVEQFRVEVEGREPAMAAAGSVVIVPRDAAVVLAVETAEADLDAYEVMLDDETFSLTDDLDAQWWLDREVVLDDAPDGQLWVRLRPGAVTGTVRAYAVLRDDYGGEGWGWLDLEIEG